MSLAAAPTTRLYLVRHGATQLTAEDRFSGAIGVELSDEGRHQAGRLADRLAQEAIAAVYCSPLSRPVETAEILARPHRLSLARRDGLREISHGRWEGLTRSEVEERYADEYAAWGRTLSRSRPKAASRESPCSLARCRSFAKS